MIVKLRSWLKRRPAFDPAIVRLRNGAPIGDEVTELAQPLVSSGELYGLAVGMLTPDGSTRTYGYGSSGLPDRPPAPDGDTLFQIGSISKLFMAALLVILVEEGQMHYEDTVRSILPAEVVLSADVGELTLYELVTNMGGLPRQPQTLTQLRTFMGYLFTGHNPYGYLNKSYLYKYLRHHRLKPKGKRDYVYSNIGYGLLAHLIEVKTGRALPDLIAEKICRPLGMKDTVFVLDADQQKRLAVGHVGGQPCFWRPSTPLPTWDLGEIMRGVGGLYSTVNDLLTFAKSNLGLLQHPLDPLLASMQRIQLETSVEGVAYGWLIDHYDPGRLEIIYKHGMVSGYSAYIGMNPSTRTAVVALSNSYRWDDKIGHNLILRLSGSLLSPD
jgi:CubicO group peptidase (beta-lactamase class C family)